MKFLHLKSLIWFCILSVSRCVHFKLELWIRLYKSFSRGSCSVAASSLASRARGRRWFGAAMPQAGRAAVVFAELFELSLVRRFGGCKKQALYMGWWRVRQICSSLSVQWCSMSNGQWVCVFFALVAAFLSEATECHPVGDAQLQRIGTRFQHENLEVSLSGRRFPEGSRLRTVPSSKVPTWKSGSVFVWEAVSRRF